MSMFRSIRAAEPPFLRALISCFAARRLERTSRPAVTFLLPLPRDGVFTLDGNGVAVSTRDGLVGADRYDRADLRRPRREARNG